jgi:hypothetical protein
VAVLTSAWFEGYDVKVLKVGWAYSTVRIDKPCGDYAILDVRHSRLLPEPCGPCGSTGKWMKLLTCKFCKGRGIDPDRNESVQRLANLVKVGEAALAEGKQAGIARADAEMPKRDVIDADWSEVKFVFPEPEAHDTNCTECCAAPCICGNVDDSE